MPVPPGLQSVSPKAARLCLGVERFLVGLLREETGACARDASPRAATGEGRTLVLALSGGLDSTALAVILKLLSVRLGVRLVGAHLDHGLRPDSDQDAAFVRDLCWELGVPFVSRRVDVLALARERATGIEDAGRQARREFLDELLAGLDAADKLSASLCALAHQLNDLAEDQLMRLARGAGWPALGGMVAFDPARRIIRPLLMTPREELRRFLEELRIPWRDDPSNQDPSFTRNRFRAEILPLFARENPNYLAAAAELWRQARVDEFYWNKEVLGVMSDASADEASDNTSGERDSFLESDTLSRCSLALRLRLYKRAVERLGPGQPLAAALHALDEAWFGRQTGKRLQFPGGKEARVERGGIRFVPGARREEPGSVANGESEGESEGRG